MANIKARVINDEEYANIIQTIKAGFELEDGRKIRPNKRVATALTLQAELGLSIGSIVKLRLTDIVCQGDIYYLVIGEKAVTVPVEVYAHIQTYALENGIKPKNRLFDLSVRAVQKHLQITCNYLGLSGVSTNSFRKYYYYRMQ